MKAGVDDFLNILEARLRKSVFVVSDRSSVADLSITGYLSFPPNESGFYSEDTHPSFYAWLQQIAALPGLVAPYDILPGKRLRSYV